MKNNPKKGRKRGKGNKEQMRQRENKYEKWKTIYPNIKMITLNINVLNMNKNVETV